MCNSRSPRKKSPAPHWRCDATILTSGGNTATGCGRVHKRNFMRSSIISAPSQELTCWSAAIIFSTAS